jgi:hypothetical protein
MFQHGDPSGQDPLYRLFPFVAVVPRLVLIVLLPVLVTAVYSIVVDLLIPLLFHPSAVFGMIFVCKIP